MHDGENKGPVRHEFYNGKRLWHVNPRSKISGHFQIPKNVAKAGDVELVVSIDVHDVFERCHVWLPVAFQYIRREDDAEEYWTLLPSPT